MATDDNIRTHLREVTGPLHAAVDEAFGAYQLALPRHYGAFLQAHAAALLPLEESLQAGGAEQWLPDWHARARSDVLREDLQALGLSAPQPMPCPREPDRIALWGVAYVLEGSRLGARFIARQVGEGMPTRYLRHGADQAWFPSFLKALQAVPIADKDRPALQRGASAAFDLFLRSARQHAPPGP